jgi:hypothetical protein
MKFAIVFLATASPGRTEVVAKKQPVTIGENHGGHSCRVGQCHMQSVRLGESMNSTDYDCEPQV